MMHLNMLTEEEREDLRRDARESAEACLRAFRNDPPLESATEPKKGNGPNHLSPEELAALRRKSAEKAVIARDYFRKNPPSGRSS